MIKKLISKYYLLFILLIYSISYGQMLRMGIWKDDNAIFFKLQHIAEPAGFFGKGLIGEGPYRFSFTPYWFIYKIFGESFLLPYYILIYIFYFLAIYSIYKFISRFISLDAGKVAGFLFACGFIASEGFFWLANAMVSDVSIIFLSFLLFFYWEYSQSKKIINYFLSLLIFWATCYFVPIRSYYFIGIIFIFEFLFLKVKNRFKLLINSLVRVIPFFAIFYWYFIKGGDARTGLLKDILNALASGKFFISYGFLSSVTNIFIADTITTKLFLLLGSALLVLTLLISILIFYLLYRKTRRGKILTIFFGIILILWYILAKSIFNVPVLNLNGYTSYVVFLGGVIMFFLLSIYFIVNNQFRQKYLFLLLSLFISVAAYSFYEPLVVFNSTHRYLVGAFFAFVSILSLLYFVSNKKIKIIIIIWGVFNLINSFFYQHEVLITRTFPVNSFYNQLMTYMPKISKGDILYFDIAHDNARSYFSDAISTASMPDETSIAWRYGIDRYDFSITRNFDEVLDFAKKGSVKADNLHTFFYTNEKLVDTTSNVIKNLESETEKKSVTFLTTNENSDLVINLKEPIYSTTPILVTLNMKGAIEFTDNLSFPYSKDNSMAENSVAVNATKRKLAFKYLDSKINIQNKAKITTSSEWMTDVTSRLTDEDIQTNWRANRLLWGKENTYLIYDMGKTYPINRFVWINGFGNSTLTKYSIDISIDGKSWDEVKKINSNVRIDSKDPQIIEFDTKDARFVRLNMQETLDGDAPQIAEFWPILTDYKDLPILETERFLNNPLGYVPDLESYKNTISYLKNTGQIQLFYLSDKDLNFETSFDSKNNMIYDSKDREFNFIITPGGTVISKLMLKNIQIPGNLILNSITYKYLNLKELSNK